MKAANLLLYCRAGFEKECAQEIMEEATRLGVAGFVKAKPDSAYALFHPHEAAAGTALATGLEPATLVFPRQVVRTGELLAGLPVGNRVTPIVAAVLELGTAFREMFLETPDTNEGKSLASLIRPLAPRLEQGLAEAGVKVAQAHARERLHVFFVGGTACHVGTSLTGSSSPWPMGIPRLHLPRAAPSRSTLKLAEALACFLGEEASNQRLCPGMTAVDLGAAPGGWTWQLVRRGLMVTAVDNGAMDAALLDSGQVKQRREDGFRFRPAQPVDWMVCDMIESPSRVCTLAARWIAEGWCRETIFNLKLPMKKRWEEVQRARTIIADALQGMPHRLRMKHLYHDREEVTVWLAAGRR
jgi:23S rRNA (cytidine2498-2'-O)-methyltransferase